MVGSNSVAALLGLRPVLPPEGNWFECSGLLATGAHISAANLRSITRLPSRNAGLLEVTPTHFPNRIEWELSLRRSLKTVGVC